MIKNVPSFMIKELVNILMPINLVMTLKDTFSRLQEEMTRMVFV